MSNRCVAAVFERYPSGGGEFALALALADNAHEDGAHIFPSVNTMAQKSRQDVRSVQRHLKTMLASGWLLLVRAHRGGRGAGQSAEYRINPRWLRGEELPLTESKRATEEKGDNLSPFPDRQSKSELGDNLSPIRDEKRVTNDAEKGDKRSTPYKNRKNHHTPLPPASGGACASDSFQAGEGAFDSLVRAYPVKRVDLARAAERWRKLRPTAATAATIISAAKVMASTPEWQAEGGRFAPKLSSWLRNSGWMNPVARVVEPVVPTAMQRAAPAYTAEELARNRQRASEVAASLGLHRRKVVAA